MMEAKHVAIIVGGVLVLFVGWYILKGATSLANSLPKTKSVDDLMRNLSNPDLAESNYGGDF